MHRVHLVKISHGVITGLVKGKVGQTEVVSICIYGRMGRAKAEVIWFCIWHQRTEQVLVGEGRGRAEAEVGIEPKAKRAG